MEAKAEWRKDSFNAENAEDQPTTPKHHQVQFLVLKTIAPNLVFSACSSVSRRFRR
jgi:hypothetical protein